MAKKTKEIPELPTSAQLENELIRVRYSQRYRKLLKNTVFSLLVVAAISILIATLFLLVLEIYGSSMSPTLDNKDIVVSVKTSELKQGDICCLYYNNHILVKRVIGVAGDQIVMDEAGNVFVNGEMLQEPYLTEKALGECDIEFPFGNNIWVNNGKNNTLNKYNSVNAAYDGCTFGLVTGINEDGTLIFADGISAPVLFGKTDGRGKTYFDDYSLQFTRSGDTYTLVAVNGTNSKNLDQFNNPSFTYNGSTTTYSHIFTNNFWPMDSASTWGATGHDPIFGAIAKYNNATVVAKNGSTTKALPPSDDGLDHNSYFGMQYSLTFELTEDYAGPLDYVFYGDDDMWVFLDGQLVCDIGGVHSSVGQYVNLWDHINKLPDSQKYGKHTLYFCYTERGASGSTCYMRFTLPSVTIDAPQVETRTLEVSKEVLNISTDREFDFEIVLSDAEGNALIDDYSYTRYDAEGNPIESGIINNSTIVKLRHDENILINYLPEGTKFTIREIPTDGYHSSYRADEGSTVDSNTAEGTMDESVSIHFLNSASVSLPSTGGSGILLWFVPLGLAFAAALILPLAGMLLKKNKK